MLAAVVLTIVVGTAIQKIGAQEKPLILDPFLVTGQIVYSNNSPAGGVLVTAVVNGKVINETETGRDGVYRLTILPYNSSGKYMLAIAAQKENFISDPIVPSKAVTKDDPRFITRNNSGYLKNQDFTMTPVVLGGSGTEQTVKGMDEILRKNNITPIADRKR